MRNHYIAGTSLATLLVLGVVLAGCVPKESPQKPEPKKDSQAVVQIAPEGYVNISADELKAMIDARENFTLLDVREPYEYEAGHINGAKLLPCFTHPDGKFCRSFPNTSNTNGHWRDPHLTLSEGFYIKRERTISF